MNELNYMEIGARIRKSRESQMFTQEKLAEMLDVSVKFISDIELGAKGMSLKTLNKLSQSLLITTDYILYGNDSEAEIGEIMMLLQKCPTEKRKYAVDLLKVYVRSIDSKC
ncbi:helix-turn-helix transcriptional regulator [Ruminococcus sp.]|uniref:helix-turn-helix domain-containing protein n=1 Tax=Ruminococcus sp. TaxID=41978 RepID=UPI002582988B|nr:helix-turn-helix transcriptional regulator [Ruminococcus sp.]MCR5021673.1 helix-turn-helix domain-containing protein [Ruminococcus sp.]